MTEIQEKPLKQFTDVTNNIQPKFYIRDSIKIDPETNLMQTPQGYLRLYFDKNDQTIHLLFSKIKENLADQPNLKRCHTIAARRLDIIDGETIKEAQNYESIQEHIRDDLNKFLTKFEDRCKKHFTLKSVKLTDQPKSLKKYGINPESDAYLFTNGVFNYLIDKKKDQWSVKLIMPIHRHDGSFSPIMIADDTTIGKLSKNSKTLLKTPSLDQALAYTHKHWGHLSGVLWDEGNILDGHGKKFALKTKFKKVALNNVSEFKRRAFTAAGMTAVMGLFTSYGTGAFAAVAAHTAGDIFFEELYENAHERMNKAQKKTKISDYSFTENATDHYRIQTIEEISRLCAHIDNKRLETDRISPIAFNDLNLHNNDTKLSTLDKRRSVESVIILAHQIGLSAETSFLDDNTRVDYFQNGIVRLMHYDREKDRFDIYAHYHPDFIRKEKLRLRPHYIEAFDDKIMRFTVPKIHDDIDAKISNCAHINAEQAQEECLKLLTFKTVDRCYSNVIEAENYLNALFNPPKNSIKPATPISQSNLGARKNEQKGLALEYKENNIERHHVKIISNVTGAGPNMLTETFVDADELMVLHEAYTRIRKPRPHNADHAISQPESMILDDLSPL